MSGIDVIIERINIIKYCLLLHINFLYPVPSRNKI